MRRIPRWAWWLVAAALPTVAGARGDTGLAAARQVRELLGAGVWAQVWRIENPAAPTSRYPEVVHALVFEFQERLWLYTKFDGTQSLSRVAGRLAEDRLDPRPLLRTVEPGFGRMEAVPESGATPVAPRRRRAPVDCFPQCVARWRALAAGPEPPEQARLVLFYVRTDDGERGHTVLEYRRAGRRLIFDPGLPWSERELPPEVGAEPPAVARAAMAEVGGPLPHRVRTLPLAALPGEWGRAGAGWSVDALRKAAVKLAAAGSKGARQMRRP